MVAPIDKTQLPLAPAPRAAQAAPPREATPAMARDGLTLAKAPEQPVIGSSWKVEGGKIHTTDTVKIDADPERVMAAVEGDWSKWWPKSAVACPPADDGLPAPVEHEKRFLFRPLDSAASRTKYVVQQFAPTAEPAGPNGELMMVVRTKLSGDFKGEGRFEIRATADGKTLVTARWEGVAPQGFAAWGPMPERVAKAHLAQEERALKHLETVLNAEK